MKKTYLCPDILMDDIAPEDVLTASGDNLNGVAAGNEQGENYVPFDAI